MADIDMFIGIVGLAETGSFGEPAAKKANFPPHFGRVRNVAPFL